MNQHSQFISLTYRRYSDMKKRFEGKEQRNGRRYGLRLQVPFSLVQYREWCIQQLQGSEEGQCQCTYCTRWLNIQTMVAEHADPPSRGGSLGLDNLVPACESCNDVKGETRRATFLHLRRLLEQVPQDDARNILGRLAKAEKLAHSHRRNFVRIKQLEQQSQAVTA